MDYDSVLANDHGEAAVIKKALEQLSGHQRRRRPGRKVLIRTDAAGCTHDVLNWLSGQRLTYSVGFTLPGHTPDLLALIPRNVWAPALDANDEIRDGACVADLPNPGVGSAACSTTSSPRSDRSPPSNPRPWPRKQPTPSPPNAARTPVLVIDEAHPLDNPQMEAVRILTNDDVDSGAPFATVLVGQPTLRQRLRLGVLAALDQRVGVRAAITGVSPAETSDSITHHLKIAGRTDTLFSADATALIHNASRGYPAP